MSYAGPERRAATRSPAPGSPAYRRGRAGRCPCRRRARVHGCAAPATGCRERASRPPRRRSDGQSQHEIPRAPIARIGQRDFSEHPKRGERSRAEPPDQRLVALVADGVAHRMEPRPELQSQDGRHGRKVDERRLPTFGVLEPPVCRLRPPKHGKPRCPSRLDRSPSRAVADFRNVIAALKRNPRRRPRSAVVSRVAMAQDRRRSLSRPLIPVICELTGAPDERL